MPGLLALALLIFLQFTVAWVIARWGWLRGVVKSAPTHLFYGGEFIDTAIRESRLNREEILSILRSSGSEDIRRVQAIVLETDGSFSVIPMTEGSPESITPGHLGARAVPAMRMPEMSENVAVIAS